MGPNGESQGVKELVKEQHAAAIIYPDDILNPYSITTDLVAGTESSLITIISGSTIPVPFDVHWVNFRGMPSIGTYRLKFYTGVSNTYVGVCETTRTSNQDGGRATPIKTGKDGEPLDPTEDLKVSITSTIAGPEVVDFSISIHKLP
jgi:hypothetical protein